MYIEFSRGELSLIENRARDVAWRVVSPYWKKAYEDLAHSANVLDAMYARSTVKETEVNRFDKEARSAVATKTVNSGG